MEFPIYSSTDAMRGKQLLQNAGIRAFVGKRSGDNGCYYYLKFAERYESVAKKILEENGITI